MGIFPANKCKVDKIHEGRVGVIVNGIAIDVAEHVTALLQDHGLVEVDTLQRAPLYPEGFHSTKCGSVEPLKAAMPE